MADTTSHKEIVDRFLNKWERRLEGSNYVVELGFKCASHKGESTREEDALSLLLGSTSLGGIEFSKSSDLEMKSIIEKLLTTGDYEDFPSHFNETDRNDIREKMLPKYYEHLKHYVSLGSSNIYQLSNVPEMPVFNIFWSFSYLVSDHNRGTSIIIWGGASD